MLGHVVEAYCALTSHRRPFNYVDIQRHSTGTYSVAGERMHNMYVTS